MDAQSTPPPGPAPDPAPDAWAALAAPFVDGAYATVKGRVRTLVLHSHLLEYLPPPPATVLDVGGGAGHQSFPLAEAGYDVTLLDSSPAMLDRARERMAGLSDAARDRVTLVEAAAEDAAGALDGRTFDAVLCHGVLGYQADPGPIVEALCDRVAPGGLLSIMTGNAHASAVRPALEQRWADALAAFGEDTEIGVLGVEGRADSPEEIAVLTAAHGVAAEAWFGTWLFVDWLGFAGIELDPTDEARVAEIAAVELEASRRDPYRALSRAFHLIGRKFHG